MFLHSIKSFKIHNRTPREISTFTIIIAGDFNNPLSIIDRKNRHTVSKNIENVSYTISQLDPIGIHITFIPNSRTHITSRCIRNMEQDRLYPGP